MGTRRGMKKHHANGAAARPEGRSFHHGRFIRQLREGLRWATQISAIFETEVTSHHQRPSTRGDGSRRPDADNHQHGDGRPRNPTASLAS